MRVKDMLIAASLFWVAAAAHADIIQYYTVSGTLTSGGAVHGTVNGTLTYSTSNVYRSSFAFTVDLNGMNSMYDLDLTKVVGSPGSYMPTFTSLIFDTPVGFGGNFDEIALLTRGDFGSAALCTLNAPCDAAGDVSSFYSFNGSSGQRFDFGSGSLTPGTSPGVTPEPSTFVLLGTSLLGVGYRMRRRLAEGGSIHRFCT